MEYTIRRRPARKTRHGLDSVPRYLARKCPETPFNYDDMAHLPFERSLHMILAREYCYFCLKDYKGDQILIRHSAGRRLGTKVALNTMVPD